MLRKEERRKSKKEQYRGSEIEKIFVYEERFPERFTGFQDPPVPAHCSTKISTKYKMVKINVESFREEELRNKFNELTRKQSWDYACKLCKMPEILPKGACSRTTEVGKIDYEELYKSWDMFRSCINRPTDHMNRVLVDIQL